MKEEFSPIFDAIDLQLEQFKQRSEILQPTTESNTDVISQEDSEDEGEDLMETDDEEDDTESETEDDRAFLDDGVEEQVLLFIEL